MEKTHIQPKAQGLYDPQNEHENCGIGLIVDMKGRKSHDIVKGALEICVNLDHRGGCGCDPITGDGAGIFIQLPHNFFKAVCQAECGFDVPADPVVRARLRELAHLERSVGPTGMIALHPIFSMSHHDLWQLHRLREEQP